jgi:F0F1-type ATP synthase membrane subunit b/b'
MSYITNCLYTILLHLIEWLWTYYLIIVSLHNVCDVITCPGKENTMVTALEKSSIEISEPELYIEEFKQKLIDSLRKEKNKLREIADQEANTILTKAYQESSELTARTQEESRRIIDHAKEQAKRETDELLLQAQQKAEQIIANATEIVRKEAKEKSRKEVDSIIRNAKEEANKQAAKIIQTAKDEATLSTRQLLDNAKKEAEEITRSATEMRQKMASELAEFQNKSTEAAEQIIANAKKTASEVAEREVAQIVSQARTRAEKEREFILASAMDDGRKAVEVETAKILQKARQEAEEIVNNAKDQVRTQLDESSRLMLEIQQKMHQVIGSAKIPPDSRKHEMDMTPVSPAPVNREDILISKGASIQQKESPVLNITQNKINAVVYDEVNRTYRGKLKIDIAPPVDSEQIGYLEQHLLKNDNIRVSAKGGAEDGSAWIEVDIPKPLQLVSILQKTPLVKDVVGCKSYIIVALKSKQLV